MLDWIPIPTSQNDRILSHLKNGKSITQLEALNLFKCMRLGARIYDIKKRGFPVSKTMVHDEKTGKRYARYSMRGE